MHACARPRSIAKFEMRGVHAMHKFASCRDRDRPLDRELGTCTSTVDLAINIGCSGMLEEFKASLLGCLLQLAGSNSCWLNNCLDVYACI